jgi:hypothetical protein
VLTTSGLFEAKSESKFSKLLLFFTGLEVFIVFDVSFVLFVVLFEVVVTDEVFCKMDVKFVGE